MIIKFLYQNLNFLYENLDFYYENLTDFLHDFHEVGLGISRTNADSQYFIEFLVVETKQFVVSFVNVILTPNLRQALEQGCGKQTPSAGKLFF